MNTKGKKVIFNQKYISTTDYSHKEVPQNIKLVSEKQIKLFHRTSVEIKHWQSRNKKGSTEYLKKLCTYDCTRHLVLLEAVQDKR